MQIGRRSPAALASALLIAAPLAGSASGQPAGVAAHNPGPQVALDRACHETVANVEQAVMDAANGQVQAIDSHLQVVTPGVLTGQITFNASGKQVTVGGGPRATAAAESLGCGEASASRAHAAGTSGGSRVVSTLHRRFTKTGRYELTFTLNRTGRAMLAQLATADQAYYKRHPHGGHPPTLAFGVALSYSLAG
jgi:hypothetical protein